MQADHHERLLGATDYLIQTCGLDENVKDLKFGAWPSLRYPDFVKCVSDCGKKWFSHHFHFDEITLRLCLVTSPIGSDIGAFQMKAVLILRRGMMNGPINFQFVKRKMSIRTKKFLDMLRSLRLVSF